MDQTCPENRSADRRHAWLRCTVATATAIAIVTCCGTASATTDDGDGDDQGVVAEWTVSLLGGEGFTVDRECVDTLIAQLSDEDLGLLADYAEAGDPKAAAPELSPEGEALGNQLQTCTNVGGDPALLEAAVSAVLASGDGLTLDPDCVSETLALLPPEALSAVVAAATGAPVDTGAAGVSSVAVDSIATDDFDPALLAMFCSAEVGPASTDVDGSEMSATSTASSTIDPCGLLTLDEVIAALPGAGEGENLTVVEPFGAGDGCRWTDNTIRTVTVVVIESADVDAWVAMTTDGDGSNDGDLVAGIGDQAYQGFSSLAFSVGHMIVVVRTFPSIDDPAVLQALATAVAARL